METQEGEAEVEDQQDGGDDDKSATADHPQSTHLELPEGALLTLNCTTLGAIVHEQALGGDSNWPLAPSRRVFHAADEANREPPPTIDYCADPMSRRRTLISGKHQTSANERRGQRVAHQIAYIILESATTSDYESSRLRGRPQSDNNLSAAELAQTSASGVTKSSAQLDSWQQQQQQQHSDQLLAPPLLEWFINNQEVSVCVT